MLFGGTLFQKTRTLPWPSCCRHAGPLQHNCWQTEYLGEFDVHAHKEACGGKEVVAFPVTSSFWLLLPSTWCHSPVSVAPPPAQAQGLQLAKNPEPPVAQHKPLQQGGWHAWPCKGEPDDVRFYTTYHNISKQITEQVDILTLLLIHLHYLCKYMHVVIYICVCKSVWVFENGQKMHVALWTFTKMDKQYQRQWKNIIWNE